MPDAAFKALQLLNSTRATWNGPIHRAAALLLEATGPQPEAPLSETAAICQVLPLAPQPDTSTTTTSSDGKTTWVRNNTFKPAMPSSIAQPGPEGHTDSPFVGKFRCACLFYRSGEFEEASLLEECNYHLNKRKEAALSAIATKELPPLHERQSIARSKVCLLRRMKDQGGVLTGSDTLAIEMLEALEARERSFNALDRSGA